MKIYDEKTKKEIFDPDLSLGYLYKGTIVVGRTEEHKEVLEGTISKNCPNGLWYIIPEKDIVEECQYYHSYTENDVVSEMNSKIEEIRNECNKDICSGMSVELSDGSSKMFSYKEEDQTNISEMFVAVMLGATSYSYHENDGNCEMYSAKDIIRIYAALTSMKTSKLTYFNQLKQYIKTIDSVPEIKSVYYGQELTGEYLNTFNDIIQKTQEQNMLVLSQFIDKDESNGEIENEQNI